MLTKIIKWFGGLITGASLFFSFYLVKEVISENISKGIPWYWFFFTCIAGLTGFGIFKYSKFISRITENTARRFFSKNRVTDDQIQEEIRKRVLEAAKIRSRQKRKTEEIQATLDALEEIVDIPREDIEEIAENVQSEYHSEPDNKTLNQNDNPEKPDLKKRFQIPWITIGIVFLTLSLVRRGSSLYLFTSCILFFLVLKWVKEHFSE